VKQNVTDHYDIKNIEIINCILVGFIAPTLLSYEIFLVIIFDTKRLKPETIIKVPISYPQNEICKGNE